MLYGKNYVARAETAVTEIIIVFYKYIVEIIVGSIYCVCKMNLLSVQSKSKKSNLIMN